VQPGPRLAVEFSTGKPDDCIADCTLICVEKIVDRRCPVGVTTFFGWLFILDREDKCTAFVSGTDTPLKGGN
jgi:hypothetical protein